MRAFLGVAMAAAAFMAVVPAQSVAQTCGEPLECNQPGGYWVHASVHGYIWRGQHSTCLICMDGDMEVEPQNCHGGWGCIEPSAADVIKTAAEEGDALTLIQLAPVFPNAIRVDIRRQAVQVITCNGATVANLPIRSGGSVANIAGPSAQKRLTFAVVSRQILAGTLE